MNIKKRKREETPLDKVIDDATRWLDPNSDDYLKMIGALERLYKLKEQETPKRPSPDTVLIVAGNLVGILLIISYERANVVTSKALNFVLKLK